MTTQIGEFIDPSENQASEQRPPRPIGAAKDCGRSVSDEKHQGRAIGRRRPEPRQRILSQTTDGPATLRQTPTLLTPAEVAELLRTSKKAIYAMIERAQLPGVVRIGRRVLIREDGLLHWLRQKSAPSPER